MKNLLIVPIKSVILTNIESGSEVSDNEKEEYEDNDCVRQDANLFLQLMNSYAAMR